MRATKDLDFLSLFWAEAKAIGQRIIEDLPKESIHYSNTLVKVNPNSTIKMFLVPYSKLGNSWGVQDILRQFGGNSRVLEALADKINYMILRGRANDVKPMLEKICARGVKKLTHKKVCGGRDGEFLGYGHFRWNYQAYTLNAEEIKRIRDYFNIKL